MAITKDQILDGIAELTVLELKDLLDAFEEKFGVTAAAPAAVAVAGGGAAGHSRWLEPRQLPLCAGRAGTPAAPPGAAQAAVA